MSENNKIELTKGMSAIVDESDYEKLVNFKWQAHRENNGHYAVCSVRQDNGKYKQFRMHRMILNISDSRIFIDHKNGNTLDNRKENLRIASYGENSRNLSKKLKNNTSGYRGVGLASGSEKRSKPWAARIKLNGKLKHLGYFTTAEDAAKAFDKAAKELFGEFCGKLNFE